MASFVRRIKLRNYKSISRCDVKLSDLCVLVGPNGSGKSNFVDALRMVSDALNTTLEYAIRQRGGIGEVRRRSGGHPNHFAIHLELNLGTFGNGFFAFQVGAGPRGTFYVQEEQGIINHQNINESFYHVKNGEVVACSQDLQPAPKSTNDSLYLTLVSGVPSFRPVYKALSSMGFYNINPQQLRELQPHDRGDKLDREGRNLPAVIKRLSEEHPQTIRRIEDYLNRIVPQVAGVSYRPLGPRETLEFRQKVQGQQHPWRFYASAMSDGTLRSLGVLTALFQTVGVPKHSVPLVSIEEPEITIHPGAAAVLMEAIIEAAKSQQVIFTTHSPDLLDHSELPTESLRSVSNRDGETYISPVGEAAVSVVKDSLYTPGELLRLGQLLPDKPPENPRLRQSDFFESLEK